MTPDERRKLEQLYNTRFNVNQHGVARGLTFDSVSAHDPDIMESYINMLGRDNTADRIASLQSTLQSMISKYHQTGNTEGAAHLSQFKMQTEVLNNAVKQVEDLFQGLAVSGEKVRSIFQTISGVDQAGANAFISSLTALDKQRESGQISSGDMARRVEELAQLTKAQDLFKKGDFAGFSEVYRQNRRLIDRDGGFAGSDKETEFQKWMRSQNAEHWDRVRGGAAPLGRSLQNLGAGMVSAAGDPVSMISLRGLQAGLQAGITAYGAFNSGGGGGLLDNPIVSGGLGATVGAAASKAWDAAKKFTRHGARTAGRLAGRTVGRLAGAAGAMFSDIPDQLIDHYILGDYVSTGSSQDFWMESLWGQARQTSGGTKELTERRNQALAKSDAGITDLSEYSDWVSYVRSIGGTDYSAYASLSLPFESYSHLSGIELYDGPLGNTLTELPSTAEEMNRGLEATVTEFSDISDIAETTSGGLSAFGEGLSALASKLDISKGATMGAAGALTGLAAGLYAVLNPKGAVSALGAVGIGAGVAALETYTGAIQHGIGASERYYNQSRYFSSAAYRERTRGAHDVGMFAATLTSHPLAAYGFSTDEITQGYSAAFRGSQRGSMANYDRHLTEAGVAGRELGVMLEEVITSTGAFFQAGGSGSATEYRRLVRGLGASEDGEINAMSRVMTDSYISAARQMGMTTTSSDFGSLLGMFGMVRGAFMSEGNQNQFLRSLAARDTSGAVVSNAIGGLDSFMRSGVSGSNQFATGLMLRAGFDWYDMSQGLQNPEQLSRLVGTMASDYGIGRFMEGGGKISRRGMGLIGTMGEHFGVDSGAMTALFEAYFRNELTPELAAKYMDGGSAAGVGLPSDDDALGRDGELEGLLLDRLLNEAALVNAIKDTVDEVRSLNSVFADLTIGVVNLGSEVIQPILEWGLAGVDAEGSTMRRMQNQLDRRFSYSVQGGTPRGMSRSAYPDENIAVTPPESAGGSGEVLTFSKSSAVERMSLRHSKGSVLMINPDAVEVVEVVRGNQSPRDTER